MTMPDMNSPKTWGLMGGIVLLAGAGVWGLVAGFSRAETSTLPRELRADNLKAQAEEPGRLMDTMREAMRREDLTEEQRRELGQNMRGIMQEMMQKRFDEYFSASEEEKDAVLDRHIDEFQAWMKEMEQRRKDWEKEREEAEKNGEKKEPPGWAQRGAPSQEERKTRSEGRNPDQMARGMAYMGAMQKRASERGIKLPQMGPGRGFGGPGGRGAGGRGP